MHRDYTHVVPNTLLEEVTAGDRMCHSIKNGAVLLFVVQLYSDLWLTLYFNMHYSIILQHTHSAVNNCRMSVHIHEAQWPEAPLEGHKSFTKQVNKHSDAEKFIMLSTYKWQDM